MTLTELEALADAASDPTALSMRDGHTHVDMGRAIKHALFHAAANPATIKALIALCRTQHEALKSAQINDGCVKALAAYDKFQGEE